MYLGGPVTMPADQRVRDSNLVMLPLRRWAKPFNEPKKFHQDWPKRVPMYCCNAVLETAEIVGCRAGAQLLRMGASPHPGFRPNWKTD